MPFAHTLVTALLLTTATPPSADTLAKLTFQRVPGSGYGNSCLDAGEEGSFHSGYVSTPTVVFDGEVYRMWFVGGAPTKLTDGSARYGIDTAIGMATSRDGLEWELVNEGKPVFDVGPSGSADAISLSHPFVASNMKHFTSS